MSASILFHMTARPILTYVHPQTARFYTGRLFALEVFIALLFAMQLRLLGETALDVGVRLIFFYILQIGLIGTMLAWGGDVKKLVETCISDSWSCSRFTP